MRHNDENMGKEFMTKTACMRFLVLASVFVATRGFAGMGSSIGNSTGTVDPQTGAPVLPGQESLPAAPTATPFAFNAPPNATPEAQGNLCSNESADKQIHDSEAIEHFRIECRVSDGNCGGQISQNCLTELTEMRKRQQAACSGFDQASLLMAPAVMPDLQASAPNAGSDIKAGGFTSEAATQAIPDLQSCIQNTSDFSDNAKKYDANLAASLKVEANDTQKKYCFDMVKVLGQAHSHVEAEFSTQAKACQAKLAAVEGTGVSAETLKKYGLNTSGTPWTPTSAPASTGPSAGTIGLYALGAAAIAGAGVGIGYLAFHKSGSSGSTQKKAAVSPAGTPTVCPANQAVDPISGNCTNYSTVTGGTAGVGYPDANTTAGTATALNPVVGSAANLGTSSTTQTPTASGNAAGATGRSSGSDVPTSGLASGGGGGASGSGSGSGGTLSSSRMASYSPSGGSYGGGSGGFGGSGAGGGAGSEGTCTVNCGVGYNSVGNGRALAQRKQGVAPTYTKASCSYLRTNSPITLKNYCNNLKSVASQKANAINNEVNSLSTASSQQTPMRSQLSRRPAGN